MKADGQREQQRLKTRNSILDATESIMRDEGYAAVSSRRIAEKAGLKSQLVHYHFGTMDDLFLAVLRRSEDSFFTRMLKVLQSQDPIRELWDICVDTEGTALNVEFTSIAMHRKDFRDELIRSADRTKALIRLVVSRELGSDQVYNLAVGPNILAFLLTSTSRAVVMEESVGITSGHAEVVQFMERVIDGWQDGANISAAVPPDVS